MYPAFRAFCVMLGSAAEAGYIAHTCMFGCVVDDDAEEIRPCFLHQRRISELLEINEAACNFNINN